MLEGFEIHCSLPSHAFFSAHLMKSRFYTNEISILHNECGWTNLSKIGVAAICDAQNNRRVPGNCRNIQERDALANRPTMRGADMRNRSFILAGALSLMFLPAVASAATLFESATLGQTGVTKDQLLSQEVPGTNVASFNFVGVRFHLPEPVVATGVGGHFVGGFDDSSFFGAIVKLTSDSDFPDSTDLSTSDVLSVSTLTFPDASAEVLGALSVELDAGWYAVIFGTHQFNANGRGVAVRNGVDIGSPTYIARGSEGWRDLPDLFDNHRFVVEGTIIPEPTAATIALLGILATVATCRGLAVR